MITLTQKHYDATNRFCSPAQSSPVQTECFNEDDLNFAVLENTSSHLAIGPGVRVRSWSEGLGGQMDALWMHSGNDCLEIEI